MNAPLIMYVIYFNTSDAPPGIYVVRRWEISAQPKAMEVVGYSKTLEDARALVPSGFYRLDRNPLDDQVIVEVWV